MSQDQRPRPVRKISAVSNGTAVPATATAKEMSRTGIDADMAAKPSAGGRSSRLAAGLFLLACAAGGAGVAALPHFAPHLLPHPEGY